MPDAEKRFLIFKIILLVLFAALTVQLFNLQVLHGAEYDAASQKRVNSSVVDKAPRGEFKDRYGKPLITNREGYSLQMQKNSSSNQQLNAELAEVVQILLNDGYALTDTLPISDAPYTYTFTDENGDGSAEDEKAEWFSSKKRLSADMSAAEVMDFYKNTMYDLQGDYDKTVERKVIGIRYEASLRGFSATSPFTVAQDVSVEVISIIRERQAEFPDIVVTKDYFRNYEYGTMASHILGGIGKMNQEEYEALQEEGYGYNDLIGKRGAEKLFEEYVRGKDGTKIGSGNLEGIIEDVPAEPGDYVVLTIDADLQQAAEKSLEKWIQHFNERSGGQTDAGAVVVLDVNNGDVLTSASYPTYDPARFNQDYQSLLENEDKPMWNRPLSGTYTPGSTFKPLSAIAAIESGAVTVDETIVCQGVYKYYKGYQPRCWIWSETGDTHGGMNAQHAIENSCNIYFYEAGRRMGIETIDKYAEMFGLGELTGIEFGEEAKGTVSSPEYKEKIVKDEEEKQWYPGDTIQTAIGQSYSAFTPIQLANYIATIANGGTRYKTHILKSVRSTKDGSIVYEQEPEILGKPDVAPETYTIVKNGMKGVVDDGSASSIFKDYPVTVGGKTGTAQVGGDKANTALFVAFAPFDSPEIAVAVVLEKGMRGMNAAYVARDIFDEYFGKDEVSDEKIRVEELLP